jgi:transposase-like protein
MSNSATPRWRILEKQVRVSGKERYLWRQAVDDAGEVLEFFVTEGRDEVGATRFLKEALARR